MSTSCGDVEAVHPLDPDTPADQQSPSVLEGRVISPTGFDANALDEVIIHLDPVTEGLVSRTAEVEKNGRFTMENVVPGSYRLTAWGPGLTGGPLLLDVRMGSNLGLGAVPLSPVLGQVKGWVFTTRGQPATGAVVSSDDGYEVTVVDTEGRFTIRVLEGQRVVSVVLSEHDPWTSTPMEVSAWSEFALEQPVFLPPHPGNLHGQVGLREFSTPRRASRIQMTLLPILAEDEPEAPNEDESPPAAGAPSAAGAQFFPDTREERRNFIIDGETGIFILKNIDPGPYMLELRAAGYESQRWPMDIRAGESTTLGRLELTHTSHSPRAVQLSGRVRTGGVGLVAVGLQISIEPSDGSASLSFARLITDSNGEFSVAAAADELYSVRGQVTGFPEIDGGPFQYIPGQGFRAPNGTSPDFNLGEAGP
jgi:hypothetical protein